jgi:ubiquinone/menaquinone biosynthesis C-methylase UbiE
MTREITPEVYDADAKAAGTQAHLDNFFEPATAAMKLRVELIIDALKPSPGETILDIGCGVGTFAFHAAKSGAITTGIDYSPESIKTAKEITARYKLSGSVQYIVGSAFELPFKDSSFDKIVTADFIEHITDDEKHILCREMRRVLKQNGSAVIFTPNKTREDIALIINTIKHHIFGTKIPFNDLHYGLITKKRFDKILKKNGFDFKFNYCDTTRPFLAHIPLVKLILSLNLIWTATKQKTSTLSS